MARCLFFLSPQWRFSPQTLDLPKKNHCEGAGKSDLCFKNLKVMLYEPTLIRSQLMTAVHIFAFWQASVTKSVERTVGCVLWRVSRPREAHVLSLRTYNSWSSELMLRIRSFHPTDFILPSEVREKLLMQVIIQVFPGFSLG